MQQTSGRIVYLNGQYIPVEKAYISVMDRGFLFGDGVYEVIPVFNGRLFRGSAHLQRLAISLAAIKLTLPFACDHLLAACKEVLRRNIEQGPQQSLYLQITRGAGENREAAFPADVSPTVFIQSSPAHSRTFEQLIQGASAITVQDVRWAWCYIKAITLLPNILFAEQARSVGADEAILIRDGLAWEGAISNLFIVKNGALVTPPANRQILRGITRDLVLELAQQQGIPCREDLITENELKQAHEVWVTGSIKEILPITKINDTLVADGKVGPMWHKLYQAYQSYKQSFAEEE
jgi:D-alanine transaminase